MTFKTALRDGEQFSADMVQRQLAATQAPLADCPVQAGVGTGYSAGVVGKMNGAAGGAPNHFSATGGFGNRNIQVTGGWSWVVRDSGASSLDPRVLFVEVDSTTTVTCAANASGSGRIDTICLRVDMTTAPDATGSNLPTVVIVQGGAANALGNAPADSALYLPLCNVAVANGATTLSTANVTDKRMVHPSQAQFIGHNSVPTSIPSNLSAATIITLVADSDKAGMLSANQWMAPLPGRYQVGWAITGVPANAAGIWGSAIWQAAAQAKLGAQYVCNVTGVVSAGSTLLTAAYGDLIDLRGTQNSTAAVNSGASAAYTYLSITWVGF